MMTPKTSRLLAATGAWAMLLLALAGGCKSHDEQASSASYLLQQQHDMWVNARAMLADGSAQPNLTLLGSIDAQMSGPMRRRVVEDYAGKNKAQVLTALDALTISYRSQVMAKLQWRGMVVVVRKGATLEEVRQAFAKVDKEFADFEALTR